AGDLEYAFKHMLTQDAAYTSISIEQRSLLHERIGSALETLFAESANDHLSELAHHYSRSSNGEKAVPYLESAGRQAVNRGALREAEIHFRHAIGALRTIPETSERIRREFDLQFALLEVLLTIGGSVMADDVQTARRRVQELSEQTANSGLLMSAFM